jgi:hypothetical protein
MFSHADEATTATVSIDGLELRPVRLLQIPCIRLILT